MTVTVTVTVTVTAKQVTAYAVQLTAALVMAAQVTAAQVTAAQEMATAEHVAALVEAEVTRSLLRCVVAAFAIAVDHPVQIPSKPDRRTPTATALQRKSTLESTLCHRPSSSPAS